MPQSIEVPSRLFFWKHSRGNRFTAHPQFCEPYVWNTRHFPPSLSWISARNTRSSSRGVFASKTSFRLCCPAPPSWRKFAATIRSASSSPAVPARSTTPTRPQPIPRCSTSGLPVLGICYGLQFMTHTLGGKVHAASKREYGHAEVSVLARSALSASCPRRFPSGCRTATKRTNSRPASGSSRVPRTPWPPWKTLLPDTTQCSSIRKCTTPASAPTC